MFRLFVYTVGRPLTATRRATHTKKRKPKTENEKRKKENEHRSENGNMKTKPKRKRKQENENGTRTRKELPGDGCPEPKGRNCLPAPGFQQHSPPGVPNQSAQREEQPLVFPCCSLVFLGLPLRALCFSLVFPLFFLGFPWSSAPACPLLFLGFSLVFLGFP